MEHDEPAVCWLTAAQLRLMAGLAGAGPISAPLIQAAEIYEREAKQLVGELRYS